MKPFFEISKRRPASILQNRILNLPKTVYEFLVKDRTNEPLQYHFPYEDKILCGEWYDDHQIVIGTAKGALEIMKIRENITAEFAPVRCAEPPSFPQKQFVTINPTGTLISSSGSDGNTAVVYCYHTGFPKFLFTGGHEFRIMCGVWIAETTLVTASDNLVCWHLDANNPKQEISKPRGIIQSMVYNPKIRIIATLSLEGIIGLFDSRMLTCIRHSCLNISKKYTCIEKCDDLRILAIGSETTVELIDIVSLRFLWEIDLPPSYIKVTCLNYCKGHLLIGTAVGFVIIYDFTNRKFVHEGDQLLRLEAPLTVENSPENFDTISVVKASPSNQNILCAGGSSQFKKESIFASIF